MITELYLQTWQEARTRFNKLLPSITEEILNKKPNGTSNSVAFLLRHIGDVELLFAKNVFGASDLKVQAKTVIVGHDEGYWGTLAELLEYQNFAYESLKAIISSQKEEDWLVSITTKEFGTKTKAEAIGRIISHTAYHAGQLNICIKYGV